MNRIWFVVGLVTMLFFIVAIDAHRTVSQYACDGANHPISCFLTL